MSLTRNFFPEFRPLFRMLDEPIMRSPRHYAGGNGRSIFDDPFFQGRVGPAVEVAEEGDQYIVEAELPGFKKEDVQVSVGEGGKSLVIEGTAINRLIAPDAQNDTANPAGNSDETAVTKAEEDAPIEAAKSSRHFSRTIWLPRRVDGASVKAKLTDGILTVTIPKAAEDAGRVSVRVE